MVLNSTNYTSIYYITREVGSYKYGGHDGKTQTDSYSDPNYNALYKRVTKQNANEGTFGF